MHAKSYMTLSLSPKSFVVFKPLASSAVFNEDSRAEAAALGTQYLARDSGELVSGRCTCRFGYGYGFEHDG